MNLKDTFMNKPISMSSRIQVRFLALFLLFPVLLGAARPFPHEEGDLPVDERVQWGTLDNGLRWVILPWNEPPERVSLRLLVEAGSLQETERQKGLAHLIEHMAFNGTRHFSAGEMVEYFQRLGMAFGPDTNAHTWWRETVYKLELPRNEEALLEDGFTLLRDYADGMLMEEAEIEKEKGVVLSEYRDRNSPQFKAYRDSLEFALPDSLISKRVVIGDEDVIRMASREDLMDYYRKWYTPERMVIIAVGDVEPDRMQSLVEKHFASMAPAEAPVADPDLGTIEPVERKVRLFSHPELNIGSLEIYTRKKIEPRPDTLEQRLEKMRLDMASAMLSRRFDRLRKQEGAVFISGSAYAYPWLDFVHYAGVQVRFPPKNREAAMAVATSELRRALEFGFSESELAEVKANLINGYEESAAQGASRKSRELSSSLVRSVRDGWVFMDPLVARDLFVPIVEAMTLEEVEAAFRAAWEPEERLIYAQGNFEEVVDGEFDKALAVEVEAAETIEVSEWGYTDFGEPSEIVQERTIEDLDIHQVTFGNGVRLSLKQTDFADNEILVEADFGEGKREMPRELPGLDVLASSIFELGGLGKHSVDDLKLITAGKTVGVNFGIGDGSFSLSGATNEEDLLLQLQMLAAYLVDPGFRPEAQRLFMRSVPAFYQTLRHNPSAVMQDKVAAFLASGDYRFGFPEREELEARTTEEAAAWLKESLSSSYLELSIVGDFEDRDTVIALVGRTFGSLPARAAVPPDATGGKISFPEVDGPTTFTYISEIDRAMATLNWPTTDRDDIFVTRRLGILGDVYTDRMRIEIREAIGEAYSPYAYNYSSETWDAYGFLRAVVGVDPSKVEEIEAILLAIGRDLAEEGISEDELVRAIEPTKASIEETRRSNRYWLSTVLSRSHLEPERLDWARTFADFWDTITVEQINDLARTYLKPEDGIPVRIVPQS